MPPLSSNVQVTSKDDKVARQASDEPAGGAPLSIPEPELKKAEDLRWRDDDPKDSEVSIKLR